MTLSCACVPTSRTDPIEVGGAEELVAQPPVFPETGEVPPELLVEGLVYDFTNREVDLDLWAPRESEARCAAESIVESYGGVLSDLGYEPGRSGAAINEIALTPEERVGISQLFLACVDAEQMLGSMFMGSDHMRAREATCMASGLADTAMPLAVVEAWMNDEGFDPIGEDGDLARLILDYTNVCLSPFSFFWTGVELPGDEELQGVDDGDSEGEASSTAGNTGGDTITSEQRRTGDESG
ncbi:MAG: hypothetical protein ACK5O2_12060 [Microthrixaceae bacterium]